MTDVIGIVLALIGAVITFLLVTKKSTNEVYPVYERKRASDRRQYYFTPEEREEMLKRLRVLDARIAQFASLKDHKDWYRYKFTHLFYYDFGITDWDHLTDLQIEDSIHFGAPMVERAGRLPF